MAQEGNGERMRSSHRAQNVITCTVSLQTANRLKLLMVSPCVIISVGGDRRGWEAISDGLGMQLNWLTACLTGQFGSLGGSSLLERGHEQREPR